MARRSRYLHYDEQMTALMKRGNLSQIPADEKDFDLLIDINRKMQEGKGRGYLVTRYFLFHHCSKLSL